MVVDDNRFIRGLLENTVRALGIQQVITLDDGAAAIKRLKLSTSDPVRAGVGTVDLILSDYLMPGVDGNLFLRWIRTGTQVPDRFVPFIMISGAADRDVVHAARDAGVTEFLAKPFSAKSIFERILGVINKPRQFVLARGYFGPDRRRGSQSVAQERRTTEASQIQIVNRESNVKALRDDVQAVYIRPANKLRDKLGANALKGEVDIDPMIIQAAEQRIQSLLGDYTDWMGRYLNSMTRSLSSLEVTEEENHASNAKHMANINRISHELRGQGGIFDYPLITALGKSLYEATADPDKPLSQARLELIQAHVDAMRTVFKEKISGNGGEVGTALLLDIRAAVKRYAA